MEVEYSLAHIEAMAEKFISITKPFKVFAFNGNLGAGKTTFIQAICKGLGVKQYITSPTFSIINEYRNAVDTSIFHIDLYRLKDAEEVIHAGVEQCLYSGGWCFIEWPEIAFSLLPHDTVNVDIKVLSDTARRMKIRLPV